MAAQAQEPESDPASTQKQEQRSRKIMRGGMSFWAIGCGIVLILFFRNYTISSIPAPWLGYGLVALGVAALLGVNVFWGGPLDKQRDR